MSKKDFFRIRVYFTLFISISIWALLAWQHFNGGVPSHHLLADESLPAVSNSCGALLLPLLTWFLSLRMSQRVFRGDENFIAKKHLRLLLFAFLASLMFGAVLSSFFIFGYTEVCGYMVLILLPLAMFLPIYRAEYLLGFVLGMTFTFGAILPAIFGTVLCIAGAALFLLLRPALLFIGSKFTRAGAQ